MLGFIQRDYCNPERILSPASHEYEYSSRLINQGFLVLFSRNSLEQSLVEAGLVGDTSGAVALLHEY